MAKRKTSKPDGFEIPNGDPLFDQMMKMNLLEPMEMCFKDYEEEADVISVGILKAINGHHRNVVGHVLDIITEIYIRRAGE